MSTTARRRVRQARRVQRALTWALRDTPPVEVPAALMSDGPAAVAAVVRDWLDVSLEQQLGWSDDRVALRSWRAALEQAGVFVFILEIGRADVRGFSMWDDQAPVIVSNLSGVSAAARVFTLAHELGHLVLRKDSACIEPQDGLLVGAEVERWCEEFAAALLMPSKDVNRWLEEADGTATVDTVRQTMRRYRVSARAAALRLIELGHATSLLYNEVARTFVPAPPNSNSTPRNPPRHEARVRQFGERALSEVLEHLPPRDALNVLRITVEDARQLPETVRGLERL